MKILLAHKLTYVPALNGASKADRALLEGLAGRNHSCQVVTLASTAPDAKGRAQFRNELAIRGIDASSFSSRVDVFLHKKVEVHAVSHPYKLYAHLIDEIHRFRPTWTLVSEDPSYLCLAAALEASPSRVVYVAHSQATLPFGPECFAADPKKTELLRQATGIITLSEYVKDYLRRCGGLESVVSRFPVYGTGPFPRLGRFEKGFVTMVNPSAIKGVSIFLELARSLPSVQFAVVPTWATTGTDRTALERMPNVQVLTPTEDIDEIFAQTRILLVPSLWGEAFGHIVVEAMLRGIPVLASNVGGLPEAKLGVDYVIPVRSIERYSALLDEMLLPIPAVPEQDIGPWLDALHKLLSDRDHYDRVSTDSREAALAYESSLSVTAVEEYLEGLGPAPTNAAHNGSPVQNEQSGQKTRRSPELLEDLSPERLELLAFLLKKNVERVLS